ncbi:MAG: DUF2147 domain-containing protein [Treponemataceae bacterium]
MKKFSVVLMLLAVVALGCFAADPAEGLWKSIDDKTNEVSAVWKIWVDENGVLLGTIVAVVNHPQDVVASACKPSYKGFPVAGEVNKMHTVGTPWIFNMQKVSDGVWDKGSIIDPGNGKMYGCKIIYMKPGQKNRSFTAKTESLAMAGVVGPIQVFQYWVKATEADIADVQAKFPAAN